MSLYSVTDLAFLHARSINIAVDKMNNLSNSLDGDDTVDKVSFISETLTLSALRIQLASLSADLKICR